METLLAWTTLVVVDPTARQGEQEQHWDGRRSQCRLVMNRICPCRSGLERREGSVDADAEAAGVAFLIAIGGVVASIAVLCSLAGRWSVRRCGRSCRSVGCCGRSLHP